MINGYEERRAAFEELDVKIVAASVDSEEKSQAVAKPLGYPLAYGVTKEQADVLGSWWDNRNFIQPSEFVLSGNGAVLMSTYSNSPLGRMDPAETLTLLTMIASRNKG